MKTLVLVVLIVFVVCGFCDAAYVIINPDNSIHCFEEKALEQLTVGRQRFDLMEYPIKHHIYYEWKNGELKERNLNDVQAEIDAAQKELDVYEKIDAEMKLLAIESLKIKDPTEDYSKQKSKHEKTINDRKDN